MANPKPKFQVGDRVAFIDDPKTTGSVIGTGFDAQKFQWQCTIQWDNYSNSFPITYTAIDAELLFDTVISPNAHLDQFQSFEKLLEENTKASFDALKKLYDDSRFNTKWYDDNQVNPNQKCAHVRKTYFGFTESYDYCDKCGEKL